MVSLPSANGRPLILTQVQTTKSKQPSTGGRRPTPSLPLQRLTRGSGPSLTARVLTDALTLLHLSGVQASTQDLEELTRELMLTPDQMLTSGLLSEMYEKSNLTTFPESHQPTPNYILEEVNTELRRALRTAESSLKREIDDHTNDMKMTEQALSEQDVKICELKQELKERRSDIVRNKKSISIRY